MKRIVIIIAAAAIIGVYSYFLRGGATLALNTTQLRIGEKYLAELNYEKATAALERVITVEPNNTEAYLALAKAYRYMGDVDTARETLASGYNATNSAVIERELTELSRADVEAVDTSAAAVIAAVEIAGRSYPADIAELVLRDCGLNDADMAKLAEFTSLERLDISGNGITDVSVVGKLTTLKKFYAANNSISDISPLSSLQSLEYIGLRGNRLTNADALFSLGSLKYLHLSDNRVTSVPNIGGSLQLLYLANNQLGDTTVVENAGLLYFDIRGNTGK
jgi:tetratricopeptide (TPR) repeat protein